jgi:hypothetical protein
MNNNLNKLTFSECLTVQLKRFFKLFLLCLVIRCIHIASIDYLSLYTWSYYIIWLTSPYNVGFMTLTALWAFPVLVFSTIMYLGQIIEE